MTPLVFDINIKKPRPPPQPQPCPFPILDLPGEVFYP
jgi:hypothetical protein